MEEDIQNHSPTVMFRGTPCISVFYQFLIRFRDDSTTSLYIIQKTDCIQ